VPSSSIVIVISSSHLVLLRWVSIALLVTGGLAGVGSAGGCMQWGFGGESESYL
jgi:hypothetical protein